MDSAKDLTDEMVQRNPLFHLVLDQGMAANDPTMFTRESDPKPNFPNENTPEVDFIFGENGTITLSGMDAEMIKHFEQCGIKVLKGAISFCG